MSTGWTDPVDWITAGAIGEPGARTFFLQAGRGDDVITLLLEKEQVDALARHVQALLMRLQETTPDNSPIVEAPEFAEFAEPLFRVGQMSLGVDTERNLILLQADELLMTEDDDDDEDLEEVEETESDWSIADLFNEPDIAHVRLWATRGQMAGMAERGAAQVGGGRPLCPLCGQPMEAEGEHFCVAMNGHRKIPGLE